MSATAFTSATGLAQKIRDRQVSCVELLQHYLDRVDRFNDDLNCIVVDVRDQALEDARAADEKLAAGDEVGPLHGVPTTIKESYNLAGTPTTWGNPAWKDNIASEDAEPVKRLKAAGAIVFGKTNVPLMLADFQSYNEVYGTTNNPYNQQSLQPRTCARRFLRRFGGGPRGGLDGSGDRIGHWRFHSQPRALLRGVWPQTHPQPVVDARPLAAR